MLLTLIFILIVLSIAGGIAIHPLLFLLLLLAALLFFGGPGVGSYRGRGWW